MINREKIEEWIKEVEERPSSAPVILQYIAKRLQDLTRRNEELLAELIALQSGARVEENEKRIAHLEYQLDLIKRQIGGDLSQILTAAPQVIQSAPNRSSQFNLLIYDSRGRIMRIDVPLEKLREGGQLGRISGILSHELEPLRMLAVPANEELLIVFSTGRISTLPARDLPLANLDATGASNQSVEPIDWKITSKPVEPHGGETLTCIARISCLALADHFIQVSRRGFLKKIRIGMADSILQNRFIGAGIKKTPDRNFEILLCKDEQQIALLTTEGYLACLEIKNIPFSIEAAIRLSATDHLAAAFLIPEDRKMLVMTNVGKAVHLSDERFAITESSKTHGQAIYSAQRRAQGARVIGALRSGSGGWIIALDRTGKIGITAMEKLSGSGVLGDGIQPVAITLIPASGDA